MKIPEKEKNKKEFGLVVSQQTLIRNQGLVVSQLSSQKRGKFRKRGETRNVVLHINIFWGKKVGKEGEKNGNSEKENNKKEFGLVVSQADPYSE